MFPLTRADALARLAEFLPHAGADYARLRNKDQGEGRHHHVSRLSAALRRRLIREEEVAAAVLQTHGMRAEKFLSEVLWRTYWKGWLEQRPAVWASYARDLALARARLASDPALARAHAAACAGQTGIDAFDGWAGELAQTGYLHNWARMQFASIWVFTLGLPWELGAALTLERFIDGDPASNTLSWRWVAGLHTAGKHYLADAARITEMTGGRYAPKGLATRATVPAAPLPAAGPWRAHQAPDMGRDSLLLLTTEDLSVETLSLPPITALAFLPGATPEDRTALQDAMTRARAAFPQARDLGAFSDAGGLQIVTGFAPLGPVAEALQSLPVTEILSDWDALIWPHCRKGFFALKEQMPRLLGQLITPRQGVLDV